MSRAAECAILRAALERCALELQSAPVWLAGNEADQAARRRIVNHALAALRESDRLELRRAAARVRRLDPVIDPQSSEEGDV